MATTQTTLAPAQALETYFAAISALDIEGYVACFAQGAQVEDPIGAPLMVKQEELRTFMQGITSLFGSLTIRPERIHLCGNEAAVPWHAAGRGRNGAEVTCDGVDYFTFDASGRITRLRAFWNPEPVMAKVQVK